MCSPRRAGWLLLAIGSAKAARGEVTMKIDGKLVPVVPLPLLLHVLLGEFPWWTHRRSWQQGAELVPGCRRTSLALHSLALARRRAVAGLHSRHTQTVAPPPSTETEVISVSALRALLPSLTSSSAALPLPPCGCVPLPPGGRPPACRPPPGCAPPPRLACLSVFLRSFLGTMEPLRPPAPLSAPNISFVSLAGSRGPCHDAPLPLPLPLPPPLPLPRFIGAVLVACRCCSTKQEGLELDNCVHADKQVHACVVAVFYKVCSLWGWF